MNKHRMGLLFGLIVSPALLGAAHPLPARAASPLSLEQVRDYAFPDQLVSSADGSRLAWIVNSRGRRNVWVAQAPQLTARPLTAYADDDGQQITSLSISADGAAVVYVRGGAHGSNWDGGLPANPTSQPAGSKVEIWSIPFAGGVPAHVSEGDFPVIAPDSRRVTFVKDGTLWAASLAAAPDPKPLLHLQGVAHSPVWSPDGRQLAFVADRGDHSFIGLYTDERTAVRWLAPTFNRDVRPRWSPDGKSIAYVRLPGRGGDPQPLLEFAREPWSIWIAELATGNARELWHSGDTLRDSFDEDGFFEWGAGGRIVFGSYQDGWQHLYSIDSGGGAPALLTPGRYSVDEVSLGLERRSLVFSANTGKLADDIDRRHVYQVSVNGGAVKTLTAGTGLEWSPRLAGGDQLVFISATAQRPPALAAQSLQGGAPRLLEPSGIAQDFPAAQLVTPRRVTFQAEDGGTVHGQLFEPERGGQHGAVVYVHGGPMRQMLLGWHPMAYYSNDYALNQYLVSRGYVVLAVNYRLGVGYGHDFQFPPQSGERGAAEYRDIRAAGRLLQSLPNVDASRIGIYGGSYGGYLTAMALAHDSDLFVVGVDIHGVHNWVPDLNASQAFSRAPRNRPPDLERAVETAWASSPVSAVESWKSPVLFIHGDDDRNVQVSQTVDLARRLRQHGVRFESIILPDEIHDILLFSNELKMNAASVDFIERALRSAN